MKYTYELCKFISGLKIQDVSKSIFEDVHYRTLDWLGCAVGALGLESSRGALNVVKENGGNPQSTVIGLPRKTSMIGAAFVNGVTGHALEYDDVNKVSITHPGAVVIPVALAVAERCGKTFSQYAMGVAAGYEMMIRLGGALNPSHYNLWHTTGTCGAFAAAAAAAKIMELAPERIELAMGIAATMASGLTCVFGTDAKLVNVGNAAANGIMAVELVRHGFSAPAGVVEMEKGYAHAATGEEDLSMMLPETGDALMICDAYYKMHASCGHTHSALDALQELMSECSFDVEDVLGVRVEAYGKAVELVGEFHRESEQRAKFSMPYCLAAMLLYGRVTLGEFSPRALQDERIAAMAHKIFVEENPVFSEDYPIKRTERVILTLKDRELSKTVELPLGKPPFEFLERKFLSLAGMTIAPESASLIMETTLSLKSDESMNEYMKIIRRMFSNGEQYA